MSIHSFPDAHLHVSADLSKLPNGSCVNAANESDWDACIKAADACGGTAFLGVHPWFVEEDGKTGWIDRLRGLAKEKRIGIGEIGLDRFRGPSLDTQIMALDAQLDVSEEFHRPVSIHCVKRWGALVEVLKRRAPLSVQVMVHGFNGPTEVQDRLIDLGCYLSFGFALLDKGAVSAAWTHTPVERILLESDAPPSLEKRKRPLADYGDALSRLSIVGANLLGITPDELAAVLSTNVSSFLGRSEVDS